MNAEPVSKDSESERRGEEPEGRIPSPGKEVAIAKARVAHLIGEVLRLHHKCGCSQPEIARSCGLSTGAVNILLRLADQSDVA